MEKHNKNIKTKGENGYVPVINLGFNSLHFRGDVKINSSVQSGIYTYLNRQQE